MAKASIRRVQADLIERDDVTLVYEGVRRKRGRKTAEKALVVGVKEKKLKKDIAKSELIPPRFLGHKTDIVETGVIEAQSLTATKRPCPPGYSIGHPTITAGTLGFYYQDNDDDWFLVSNNHVIAASNDAVEGDLIIQPGDADGGSQPGNNFARLTKEVIINFGSGSGGGGGKKPKKLYWAVARGIPNLIAWLFRCSYRLPKAATALSVTQPNPNLVDMSVAAVLDPTDVKLELPIIGGQIQGVYDGQIGDWVQKIGRTTEHTTGDIDGIGTASVSYGPGKGVANFDDQLIIVPNGGTAFSAGGDSGSAVIDEDRFIVGLLFAGSGTHTIANRITHVIRLGNIPL